MAKMNKMYLENLALKINVKVSCPVNNLHISMFLCDSYQVLNI